MLYLFARLTPDRWSVGGDKNHKEGDPAAWLESLRQSEHWSSVPWVVVIWGEPGALSYTDIISYWTMTPDRTSLTDEQMKAFLALARTKSPSGGIGWTQTTRGGAIIADHQLESVWA